MRIITLFSFTSSCSHHILNIHFSVWFSSPSILVWFSSMYFLTSLFGWCELLLNIGLLLLSLLMMITGLNFHSGMYNKDQCYTFKPWTYATCGSQSQFVGVPCGWVWFPWNKRGAAFWTLKGQIWIYISVLPGRRSVENYIQLQEFSASHSERQEQKLLEAIFRELLISTGQKYRHSC